MKKRLISLAMVFALMMCMVSVLAVPAAAASCAPANFIGTSWYGKYIGESGGTKVERCMNLTITSCDAKGNLAGQAYVTTEVPGYTSEWIKYNFNGTVNYTTGAFTMQGNKITGQNSGTNWSMVKFTGTYANSKVTGIVDNDKSRTFTFGLVSAWAKDEITQADVKGLIPQTLYGKDLTQPVTRAEFAAISAQLYEVITGTTAPLAWVPFKDVAGNADSVGIAKAYGLNIAVGFSDEEFAPNLRLTREEMATMLCRVIKKYRFADWTFATDAQYYLDTSGVKSFADDRDISDWAKPSVYYMAKMGIIKGIGDNLFAPKATTPQQQANGYATATREQAIALSMRVYNLAGMLQP